MKRILLTLTLLATLACGNAQTLDECRRMAREHYPEIARFGLIEKSEQFSLSNAAKAWLPHGSVNGQVTWQNSVMELPEQFQQIMQTQGVDYPGLKPLQYKIGIDLSQQIWDGGVTAANRTKIKAESEVERRQTEVNLYDVDSRIEDVYFGVLLLDERIKNARLTATMLDSTLRQVDAMVANGVAMKSDRQQIAAQRLTLEQQIEKLTASRNAYSRVLSMLIGQELGEISRPNPDYTALTEHPTEQLFDSRLAAVEAARKTVNASVMPRLGAFVSAYMGYPGLNYFKSMGSTKMMPNLIAGLQLQWNFSSLYTRKNTLKNLEIQAESIENAKQVFNFNRSIASEQKRAEIESMKRIIAHDDEILQLRRDVLEAARAKLKNGILDTTALLSKITDAELAETDRETHSLELLQAQYKLYQTENQ